MCFSFCPQSTWSRRCKSSGKWNRPAAPIWRTAPWSSTNRCRRRHLPTSVTSLCRAARVSAASKWVSLSFAFSLRRCLISISPFSSSVTHGRHHPVSYQRRFLTCFRFFPSLTRAHNTRCSDVFLQVVQGRSVRSHSTNSRHPLFTQKI